MIMYVYMNVCMCIWMYVCVYECMYVYVRDDALWMHVWLFACTPLCIRACAYYSESTYHTLHPTTCFPPHCTPFHPSNHKHTY